MDNSLEEIFGLGWGTLALINAGLAQSKGRSGLAWFLGSLFIGPIATFLIVISNKPAPSYKPFPLFRPVFFKVLGVMVVLLVIVLWIMSWVSGPLTGADVVMGPISAVILAYLVHLWFPPRQEPPKEDPTEEQ